MKRLLLAVTSWALVMPAAVHAENVPVTIDVSAATAVLDAVRNPHLTVADALAIAQLPGNQGLIRKSASYGNRASDDLFARALIAAAQGDATYVDVSKFQFGNVRKHAAETEQALSELREPGLHLLDSVKARIARFTPATLTGSVTGYLVAGGTSGGFAFGEPRFYLDIDRYRSATLASTIMNHELYHAVQALARVSVTVTPSQKRCAQAVPGSSDIGDFFDSLSAEGTASYVGDILAMPEQGGDELSSKERAKFVHNLALTGRSVTQLELSVHGLGTGAAVSPSEVYELGFYGDEVMYALGYVMARAIAKEQGNAAIGEVIGLFGAAFIERYVHLNGYGKSDFMPALKPETIRWADKLFSCSSKA